MPLAAPVTTATFPASSFMATLSRELDDITVSCGACRTGQEEHGGISPRFAFS
jgi:hypothetical protein